MAIIDYVEVCGIVDTNILYKKFFYLNQSDEVTRKKVCRRSLAKLVETKALYNLKVASNKCYLYSTHPLKKTTNLLHYMDDALETKVAYHFESYNYSTQAIQRDVKSSGVIYPCVIWLHKKEDFFVLVEVARTQTSLIKIMHTYANIKSTGLYKELFTTMPLLVIVTDLKIPDSTIDVVRIPLS